MKIKEKILKKSNLWHVGAVALFLVIACAYFYPALQGYTIDQEDVKNWVGSSQEIKDYREDGEQVMWTNSIFSGMPATQISMIYDGRQIPEFFRGLMRLWLPAPIFILFVYFIGFYLMALAFRVKPLIAIVGALAYGFSSYFIIILEVGHITKAIAIGYAPLVVAGFIWAYRWKNWLLAIGFSALFMTFLLMANHVQILYYLTFVLIGLGIVELVRWTNKSKNFLGFIKVTVGLLVAYGIALMVNIGNILGSAEYANHTIRGGTELTMNADGTKNESKTTDGGLDREYITHWSYGKAETFTLLVPNFKGGQSVAIGNVEANEDLLKNVDPQYRNTIAGQSQYFGDQPFTSGGVYVGAIVFLLAILAMFYSDDKAKWALFVVTILTIMLSWGKNFMFLTDFFLDYFPGYNKFRAITIILVIAELCIPLLGIFFLQKLYKARDEIAANLKPFLIVTGALMLLLLMFLIAPGTFNTFLTVSEQDYLASITNPMQYDQISTILGELESVRVSIFRQDVARSMFFLVVGAGLIYAFIKGLLNSTVMLIGVGLMTFADLALVDRRYLGVEKEGRNFKQWVERYKQEYPYMAGAGENEILSIELQENPGLYTEIDAAVKAVESTFTKDMEGSEKQRIKDWETFRTLNRLTHFRVLEEGNLTSSSYVPYFFKCIGGYHGAKLGKYQELIEFHLQKNNPAVYDVLNHKYTIRPVRDNKGDIVNSQLININPTAMGNAWFAKDVKKVETADAEIIALTCQHTYQVKQAGEFEILVNRKKYDPSDIVLTGEEITVLFPNPNDTTGQTRDTVPVQVPYQAAHQMDLTWFIDPSTGQPNWNYDQLLDTNAMKILTIVYKGREGWDPNQTTFYRGDASLKDKYTGEGSIELTEYNPDYLVYKSSSSADQLAVFSEIYYPLGWKAFVDNKEVDIHRVNYALRGIELPAGEHTIEFVCELKSYEQSSMIAWTGSILILLLIAAGGFVQYRQISGETAEIIDKEESED